MGKTLIVLTEQDVNAAITMEQNLQAAWDAAHQAIDKLIVMDALLNYDHGGGVDLEKIRQLQKDTMELVKQARLENDAVLKFLRRRGE